jgi:hypothetical protein
MMRSVLFDDRGDVWDASSRRLVTDLHASIHGEELVEYAVRNLGFVGAKELRGSLRISLRPAVVSPIAFSALLYWLHDREADRVLVSFYDNRWSHEMLRSRADAVRRLMGRVDFGVGNRDGDFLCRELPLESLSESSPLKGVLTMWSEAQGKFDRGRLEPLLARKLNGRFVLVEASPTRPALVLKDVGGGLSRPAEYWLARSIGHRVEDQPDYDYGKWIAKFYRKVIASGSPSLSDVDAIIKWPEHSRRSFRYRRLVLPFNGERSSTMLLGASLVDPGINLRVKPA